MEYYVNLPLTEEKARQLRCGDTVYLTGEVYTSRDAGHKRMVELLSRGEDLPFDPQNATIYYVGPSPARPEVIEAMKRYSGVYFGAIGGAGALLAKCIKKAELIAWEDLQSEALRKLWVENMPLVVVIDCEGNDLYEQGRAEYLAFVK